MFKFITSKIVKMFVVSMVGYLVILALVVIDPKSPGDNVFGQILGVLIYIAPVAIVLETLREIFKERERQENGNNRRND